MTVFIGTIFHSQLPPTHCFTTLTTHAGLSSYVVMGTYSVEGSKFRPAGLLQTVQAMKARSGAALQRSKLGEAKSNNSFKNTHL